MKTYNGPQYHQYLTDAYSFFNENLFNNSLRAVVITLSHRAGSRGYYWDNIFNDKIQDEKLPELSITYNSLYNDTKTLLSTLVHEMTHVQEYMLGTNGKAPYHNKMWAVLMKTVGLQPYNIFKPHLETGNKISHHIIPDGKFDKAADEFISLYGDFALAQGNPVTNSVAKGKKRSSVCCPVCEAKFSIPKGLIDTVDITCKTCDVLMVVG